MDDIRSYDTDDVIPSAAANDTSCPALCWASTPYFVRQFKDVDGRDEPGHDSVDRSRFAAVGIIRLATPLLLVRADEVSA